MYPVVSTEVVTVQFSYERVLTRNFVECPCLVIGVYVELDIVKLAQTTPMTDTHNRDLEIGTLLVNESLHTNSDLTRCFVKHCKSRTAAPEKLRIIILPSVRE